MKLSIIVPVYNVEPYLHRCVDSILNQTFEDFELILVDDGSPDNCPAICDEYELKDSRVKVIHKINGGLSDARNAGIEIAQGDYLGFVDSDDSISSHMYQRLLDMAQKHNADLVACGILNLDQDGNVDSQWPNLTEDKVYKRQDFISNFFPDVRRSIMTSVANKIFRRNVFRTIRFPVGKIYEDAQIQLQLYNLCETVAVCHEHDYYYFFSRPGSINNTHYTAKQFDMIEFALRNYYFFVQKEELVQQRYALEAYTNNYLKNFYQVMLFHKELYPLFKPYRKEFRKLFAKVLTNPLLCRMKRLAIALLCANTKLSYMLSKKYFPECILDTMV